MSESSIFSAFTAGLAPAGLNLVGVLGVDAWNAAMPAARQSAALAPGARSIVVIGNGGQAMWRAFLTDLQANPSHLTDDPHPFDHFARRAVLAADGAWGKVPRRWFWAAADAETHIDFRVLAHLGGLGGPSRLGLVLHPTYGPWVGLRAACFLDLDLPASPPPNPDPCAGCPAPCIKACPGSAFPGGRWSVDACGAWKAATTRCATTCDARSACPVGAEHRYDPDEFLYHNNRAVGRERLREILQLSATEDRFPGTGPYWSDWKTRVDVAGPAPKA